MYVVVKINFGKHHSKTTSQIFGKLHIYFHPDTNQCLSTFGGNESTGGIVIAIFSKTFGMLKSQLLLQGITQNFKYKLLATKEDITMIYIDMAH